MGFQLPKASTILTALGCVGVVLTGIASARAAKEFEEAETTKEKVKAVAKPAAVGAVTIGCIVGSHCIDQRTISRLTKTVASLMVTAENFDKYKNEVKERYGEEVHQDIINKIMTEKCDPPDIWIPGAFGGCSELIPTNLGTKEVQRIFYDQYSKRYFESSLSKVLEAEYHYNRDYEGHGDVEHNQFYEYLGLKPIPGDEGYDVCGGLWWIDFNHRRTVVNGQEVIVIETVFTPEHPTEW